MKKKKSLKEQIGKTWGLSTGFYPGILFGVRTYENDIDLTNSETGEIVECVQSVNVLYIPFIDVALELYKRR